MTGVPSSRRVFLLALSLVFAAQVGITISLPSLPTIARDLDTSAEMAALSLSAYVLGTAGLLPLWGAAADRWGRRPVLLAALALFAPTSVALGFATDPDLFVALRLVEGVGAGGGAIVGRIVLRDTWQGAELARRFALLSASFIVALGGGQFLGARLDAAGLWRWEFFGLAGLAGVALLASRGLDLVRGRTGGRLIDSFAAYPGLLRLPAFLRPALAGALGYGALLAFQQAGPFILVGRLGETAARVGDVGLLTAAFYFTGSMAVGRLVLRLGQQRMLAAGLLLVLATGLAGLTLEPSLLAFAMLSAVLALGQAVSFPTSMAIAASSSPEHGVQATALCSFLQQVVAGLAAAAVALLPQGSLATTAAAAALLGAFAVFLAARR
jgi:predicted MFS family arabinose efflux permease